MREPETQGHYFDQALLAMDRLALQQLVARAQLNMGPGEVIEQLVVPALERLGKGWEDGTLALSQIFMGGRLCEELVDRLLPPASPQRKTQPKMAIAVLEDYHLLGKRIVYSVLRSGGYDVLDYGRVEVDGLVDRTLKEGIQILLISTLMLNSALRVKAVQRGLEHAVTRVKILVGGAPFRFDDQLWREVGADATSATAVGAIPIIRQWTGGSS
jgi:methanogenic corrinoid protein MtbC1